MFNSNCKCYRIPSYVFVAAYVILIIVKRTTDIEIPPVTVPIIYFGVMFSAMFLFAVESLKLYRVKRWGYFCLTMAVSIFFLVKLCTALAHFI